MEKCTKHSGVCEKLNSIDHNIEQVQKQSEDSFKLLRSDMKIMSDNFLIFQRWLYGLLASSFITIVVAVVLSVMKK